MRRDPSPVPHLAPQPSFEVIRLEEASNCVLKVVNIKTFKNTNDVREMSYKQSQNIPLTMYCLIACCLIYQLCLKLLLMRWNQKLWWSRCSRIYINHPNLEKGIIVPPINLEDLNGKHILEHTQIVLCSTAVIPADWLLDINIAWTQLLIGKTRKSLLTLKIISKKMFYNDHKFSKHLLTKSNYCRFD